MGRRPDRKLATVLFTDIVGSTELATELGDRRWQELLARHHRIVRRNLKRFGGREVDTAGDGFFVTFDRPTDAVRCACAAVGDVRELGVEIRAGVHTGEVEAGPAGVRGIAVHVGARVMGTAGAGEVVVSSTVRDLVGGAGFELADRGTHRLKGVDDEWRLFALTAIDGEVLAPPLDPVEGAHRREEIHPSTGPRRAWVVVAVALVVVLAIGIGVLLVGGDDGAPGTTSSMAPPANSAIAFDPETETIERAIASVVRPLGRPRIAIDGNEVWVRSIDLVHIDAEAGKIDDTFLDFGCCDVGASFPVEIGARTVWVPWGAGDEVRPAMLDRFDPEDGEHLKPIRLHRRPLLPTSPWDSTRCGSRSEMGPSNGETRSPASSSMSSRSRRRRSTRS